MCGVWETMYFLRRSRVSYVSVGQFSSLYLLYSKREIPLMPTFNCHIVSIEQDIYSGPAVFMVATGEEGELGITPGHAPLLTRLKPGKIVITLENQEILDIAVMGGFLEVQPQQVTVIADTAIRARDIDEDAARKAKQEAERLLADLSKTIDIAAAEQQLAQAEIQLQAVKRIRSQGAPKH